MKYFVYKLTHDNGQKCCKTGATSEETAINNIMAFEGCPKQAIEIKEIPLPLFNMDANTLFNLDNIKQFNDWMNSDNVIKIKNRYKTQCTLYRKAFDFDELRAYFFKEYINI
jgi:hypothetical protein